ncbi:MAG: DUF4198 domain-containing protein [bacterium]|jgi:cobalt/nickel transport protein
MYRQRLFTSMLIIFLSTPAFAHFPILKAELPFYQLNQSIQLTFSVGHPFEQEFEDAAQPEKLSVLLPSGREIDLSDQLKSESAQAAGESYRFWSVSYDIRQKGDLIFALNTKPDVDEETIYQEFIKTIIHVENMDGWRQRSGQPVEILPLTRPYGLLPGDVFTAQVLIGEKPVANTEVYIEHYEDSPPQELPPEPFITRVVVTDPNGVFSCTLPEKGWWICAALVEDAGPIDYQDKKLGLSALAAIWVYAGK